MKKLIFLLIIALATNVQAQLTKKVLFMGNSYTAGMPEIVADIAKSMGDSLHHVDGSGGQAIKDHATMPRSLDAISQEEWDYVVIQCQSQEAAFKPSYLQQNVFPYAKILADSVNKAGRCAKPIFYMTWGRKNGDLNNCQYYAPLCSYETMSMELRKNYLKMGKDNEAFVSPVGMAWRHARAKWPNIELYDADESHPSQAGIYLTACTFYAVIFGKSPVGATFKNNLTGTDADSLQKAANFIVFDSLKTWNINYDTAYNSLSFTTNSDTVDFKSTNLNLDSVVWYFGDGKSSNALNPKHIYGKVDTFTVSLRSFKGCLISDSTFQVITTKYEPPNNTSILELSNKKYRIYPNPASKNLNIEILEKESKQQYFRLTSVSGKEVISISLTNEINTISLENIESGLYFYTIKGEKNNLKYGTLVIE